MGIESIVKLIQHRITPMESEKGEINITRDFHKDDYKSLDTVITALEDGGKFEKIIRELKTRVIWSSTNLQVTVETTINALEQKYFPK